MKVFVGILVVLAILAVILVGGIWSARGGLIERTQTIDAQWGQVQNVYQRRFDLIPNLVAGITDFMKRQQATITGAIELRQRVIELKTEADVALQSGNPAYLDSISALLSQRMNSLINMVSEQYPDVKGEQMYRDYMAQMEGTENRVAQERRQYNVDVRSYNTFRQKGIFALIAGSIFGYPWERAFFKADDEAQKAPDAQNLFQRQ